VIERENKGSSYRGGDRDHKVLGGPEMSFFPVMKSWSSLMI